MNQQPNQQKRIAPRRPAPNRALGARPVPQQHRSVVASSQRITSGATVSGLTKTPVRRTQPSHVQTNPKTAPTAARRKVPEALPTEKYRESAFEKIKNTVFRKAPAIREIVREPTAGGIIFRMNPDGNDIEILLIQDSKNRWTIPKGHIEPGETAKQTAIREIGEEAGLFHIQALTWLGKIHFKYRRLDQLVLMTTQVYLVRALDRTETPTKEKWMNGIRWFSFSDALDAIEYDDIEKLMLIAKKKIRAGEV